VQSELIAQQPEDFIVHALVDYDDIAYDDHAELIYKSAGQAVQHFTSYFPGMKSKTC
jgi:type III restriction enzyme